MEEELERKKQILRYNIRSISNSLNNIIEKYNDTISTLKEGININNKAAYYDELTENKNKLQKTISSLRKI